jgi:hypothetical protein
MNKLFTFFLALIFCFGSKAQTVNIINNPSASENIIVGDSNYHASESIYTNEEIGANNFTAAGNGIEKLNFFLLATGTNSNIGYFKVWMKNVSAATKTFSTGQYNTSVPYVLVFNGTFVASPVGVVGITLTSPFVRTAGTNLQILIERLDTMRHTATVFAVAAGNNVSQTANSSRRYNDNFRPASRATILSSTFIRPAIQLVHKHSKDAGILDLITPTTSCYDVNQTIKVQLLNDGLTNINAGAATVKLKIGGANSYSSTTVNNSVIAPGGSELITFSGINLSNVGDNIDTAIVTLAGDGTTYNDTLYTTNSTASTLSNFPVVEDAEATLPVFSYVNLVAGASQLWTLQTGKYANIDQPDSLEPRTPGNRFYLFDSYSGAGSSGYVSRLFSNCIDMPSQLSPNPAPITTVSFWMSHDYAYPDALDSLYLSVSSDKGITWNRIAGFQRADAAALVPYWSNEIVDISAYNGQTIQLGFEGVSKYGNIIGLDDIIIDYTGTNPVSLLSFNAAKNGRINKLTWTTSQEINTNKFIIERSNDGNTFSAIGETIATGNSASTNNYQFADMLPARGTNYYRLRIIDNDYSYKFSTIKNIQNIASAEVIMYPNPVQNILNIAVEADANEVAAVTIIDATGKVLINNKVNVKAGSNYFNIPLNELAKGNYVVSIKLNNQTVTKKITKL